MRMTFYGPKPRKIKKTKLPVVVKLEDGDLHLSKTEWPPDVSLEEKDSCLMINLSLKYHGRTRFVPKNKSFILATKKGASKV